MVIFRWCLTMFDSNDLATTIVFNLIEFYSSMVIELDTKNLSKTVNICNGKDILLQHPTDSMIKKHLNLHIFWQIWKQTSSSRPRTSLTADSLLDDGQNWKKSWLQFVKNVHSFTHSSSIEMKNLIWDARITSQNLGRASDKAFEACSHWFSSGRPHNKRKIPITQIKGHLILMFKVISW